MDVLILNSSYKRETTVDKYESLIWTERFSAYGEIELNLHSTLENRTRFTEGTLVTVEGSDRVATVETVEDHTDDEGRKILKVKGKTLESIFERRLARGTMTNGTDLTPKWTFIGDPQWIATQMVKDICIFGTLNAGDIIPNLVAANVYPGDTVPPPTDIITYEIEPKTLYTAEKELCDLYLMGFRIVRYNDMSTSSLYFDVYTGSDRTTRQTTLPAVVFSKELDNLHNTTELKTSALYKNVAYVISPVGCEIVYALDVDPSISGFARQVLVVNATDIKDTDPVVASAKMIQRGTEELGKNRRFSMFDGELSQNSQYTYRVHYNLGDLVEMHNDDGFISIMQVTEQIFISDSTGVRSYPTLTVAKFIEPGSWAALPAAKQWDDFTTEDWGDM